MKLSPERQNWHRRLSLASTVQANETEMNKLICKLAPEENLRISQKGPKLSTHCRRQEMKMGTQERITESAVYP